MIPEVVALETKLGMIKGSEKDLFLDQIIEHLRRNSLFGKLWENAEKARQESVDSMAKDEDEKNKINDVVSKIIDDSIKPKKSPLNAKIKE